MPDALKASRKRDTVSDVERACIEKGMKMTEQRRVIARVLSESDDHPDVETVYQRASDIDPGISIATVYRTLRMFDIANIIDRHDFGDGRARYELAEPGEHHHHHLIDMRTGEVHEFDDDELERIKQRIAADLGYEIVGERLELYGVPLRDGKKKSKS
tara:strand:+ start:484 stop:957 length:474 start_codon:yes stop_codon:yes gene_type:complete